MIKTIKVKKQLRLDELIKYIFDNDITGRRFEERSDYKSYSITHAVDVRGNGVMNVEGLFNPDTKFTVEVEEEITKNMLFEWLVEVNKLGVYEEESCSISAMEDEDTIRIYAMLDEKLQLIWEAE